MTLMPSSCSREQTTEPARPPISVVVPLFNKAAYIRRTLESIRRQTWAAFEVVVVDDGSTDGGGAIAATIGDPRFRVVVQKNAGEGAARNRGIAEARADLIAFLDADDAWEPEFLEAISSLATRYPAAGILATGYRRLCSDGSEIRVTVRAGKLGTRLVENYFQAVREGELVTSSSVAVRRAALERAGGFLEREPVGADRELWARISLRYPIAYDTRLLAVYHSEAEGRAYGTPNAIHRYPPAVRSMRKLAASGELSRQQEEWARAYADWLIVKHAYDIAYTRDRKQMLDLLRSERFRVPGIEAAFLRAAAPILPLRVIAALRLKPAAWARAVRESPVLGPIFEAIDTISGRTVARRTVRAWNGSAGCPEFAKDAGR